MKTEFWFKIIIFFLSKNEGASIAAALLVWFKCILYHQWLFLTIQSSWNVNKVLQQTRQQLPVIK